MSLEATIQENTKAIRELIAALSNGVPATAAQVAAVVSQAQDDVANNVANSTPESPDSSSPAEAVANKTAPVAAPAEAGAVGVTKGKKQETTAGAKSPAAAANGAGEPATSDKAPTYAEAAAAITKLSKVKGRDAAVAVLSQFGAGKLPEVKPEQFAALIAAAEEAEA